MSFFISHKCVRGLEVDLNIFHFISSAEKKLHFNILVASHLAELSHIILPKFNIDL